MINRAFPNCLVFRRLGAEIQRNHCSSCGKSLLLSNDLFRDTGRHCSRSGILPIATDMVPLLSQLVYSIDVAARLVTARASGKLTFREIVGYASSLRADRHFSPAFSELVDLRSVESVLLSAREVMTLADCIDPFSANSKRAFVVRNRDQINAAHLHRILRPQTKTIQVFSSIEEAREWIGASSEAAMAR